MAMMPCRGSVPGRSRSTGVSVPRGPLSFAGLPPSRSGLAVARSTSGRLGSVPSEAVSAAGGASVAVAGVWGLPFASRVMDQVESTRAEWTGAVSLTWRVWASIQTTVPSTLTAFQVWAGPPSVQVEMIRAAEPGPDWSSWSATASRPWVPGPRCWKSLPSHCCWRAVLAASMPFCWATAPATWGSPYQVASTERPTSAQLVSRPGFWGPPSLTRSAQSPSRGSGCRAGLPSASRGTAASSACWSASLGGVRPSGPVGRVSARGRPAASAPDCSGTVSLSLSGRGSAGSVSTTWVMSRSVSSCAHELQAGRYSPCL